MMTEAVSLTPAEAVVKAMEFYKANNNKDAEYLLRSVLMVEPGNFDANNILGAIAARLEKFYEAHYWFSRALHIAPEAAQAISNLGMVLCHFGHLGESMEHFKRSLAIEPGDVSVMNNLATALNRLGRDDEALAVFDGLLEADKEQAMTYFNRAICLLRLGRLPESIAGFDEALRRNPGDHDAHYNRGIARLSIGDIAGGFADYEHRMHSVNGPYYIGPFRQPKWTGAEDLHGKRILVHGEQGIGDSIQFLRYVPMLIERGAKVFLVLHNPLYELGKSTGAEVLIKGDKLPDFDYWTPLMSLALAFGTTAQSIPPPAELSCAPGVYAGDVTDRAGGRLKVGVCWSGNWQHKNDRHRSVDLTVFRSLFYMGGVAFFNLQKDVRPVDEDEFKTCKNLIDLTGSLRDMRDTAGLIKNLDLVITVDTCVAHLAGSLGIPTWVLIPAYSTDWRWQHDRTDSPWYPSMRLFRQQKPDPSGWPDIIRSVADQLRKHVADR